MRGCADCGEQTHSWRHVFCTTCSRKMTKAERSERVQAIWDGERAARNQRNAARRIESRAV